MPRILLTDEQKILRKEQRNEKRREVDWIRIERRSNGHDDHKIIFKNHPDKIRHEFRIWLDNQNLYNIEFRPEDIRNWIQTNLPEIHCPTDDCGCNPSYNSGPYDVTNFVSIEWFYPPPENKVSWITAKFCGKKYQTAAMSFKLTFWRG